jgi:TonB family protein
MPSSERPAHTLHPFRRNMVPGLALPTFASAAPPARRLALGLALSILVHVLVAIGVRPMASSPPAPVPFVPLMVEIAPLAPVPEAKTRIASATPSEEAVPPPESAPPSVAAAPRSQPAPVTGLDLQFAHDRYYTSREVDVRAEPVNEVDLVYPQPAYQQRIKGRVVLRLLINERGGLDDVSVLESEPRGFFEEAALTATRALVFSPARRHGRSVKSQKTIEVAFDPYERIHIP